MIFCFVVSARRPKEGAQMLDGDFCDQAICRDFRLFLGISGICRKFKGTDCVPVTSRISSIM